MVKKQYAAVDIAKYVSALLVVCIHTFPFIDINEMLNTYFIQTICRLAVPFFFMISGYFLFRKIRNEEEDKDVLKKVFISLIKNLFDLDRNLFALYDLQLCTGAIGLDGNLFVFT